MQTVSKSELEARMLEYFRKVEETGEELIVTDDDQPVLCVIPIRSDARRRRIAAATIFADVQGRLIYHEDPFTATTGEWTET